MAGAGTFEKLLHGRDEDIVEPELPIIDSHHHLYERQSLRYLADDYLQDARAGHRIIGSVYVEASAFYRPDGPEALKPVGEVEFANVVGAAMEEDAGKVGPQICAAIVGFADMTLGDGIAETLDASMAAAPDRYRGVRQIAIEHPDPEVLRNLAHRPPKGLLTSDTFQAAMRQLQQRGLSFDATVLHHQLADLGRIAGDFPETTIVLNHAGLATMLGCQPEEKIRIFRDWANQMKALARHENVVCKIGGLGTSYWGFGLDEGHAAVTSAQIAELWRPYVESTIEAFGPDRCMMESNYPNDGRSCGFVSLWNAMKRIVSACSQAEKQALFAGTATAVYRLSIWGQESERHERQGQ